MARMKEIQIGGHYKTNGKRCISGFALVDDKDYEELNKYRWSVKTGDYIFRYISGSKNPKRYITMHQQIMGIPYPNLIDHIDRNPYNNQRNNLRIADRIQNGYNRKTPSSSSSGFKGVYWNKIRKSWRAHIKVSRRNIHLGYFADKKDAARAYNKAASRFHGAFAVLNKI